MFVYSNMKNFGYLCLILLLDFCETQGILSVIEDKQACNCSLLGTVSSIEGDSICDEKTLECKCYPNVTGLNCDECREDHYGLMSSEGCLSCSCSAFGSLGSQCDLVTGQCSCKPGHAGLTCDQCEPLKYGYGNGCTDCNCDVIGSKDLQCDRVGQCACRENIEGKHCNRCKENTYNLTKGCIPCPPCYNLVLNEMLTLRKNMTLSEKAIDRIEEKLPTIIEDYENFIKEIQSLNDKIVTLKPNDTNLSLEKHEKLFLDIEQEITNFENSVQSSTNKLVNLKPKRVAKLVAKIKNSLKDTGQLLQSGQSELKNAATRSEKILTHNATITQMSKSAETAFEQIQKLANEITEDSTKISALTAETCKQAEQFNENEKRLTAALGDLVMEVTFTSDGILALKENITEFSKHVKKTQQEVKLIEGQQSAVIVPTGEEMHQDYAVMESNNAAILGVVGEVGDTAKEFDAQIASMDAYLAGVGAQQKAMSGYLLAAEGYQIRANSAIELMGSAFAQGLSYMASYAEYEKMQQSLGELMKGAASIQAIIELIHQHERELTAIFEELLEIIRSLEKLKLVLDGLLNIIEGNSKLMLTDVVLIKELEAKEKGAMAQLEEYEIQLKSVRHNVDELNKIESETSDKIKEIEMYVSLLDAIIEGEKTMEEEIEKLESMYNTIDDYAKLKETLQENVTNVKEMLESLPIDDNTLCEAPISEPKLVEGG